MRCDMTYRDRAVLLSPSLQQERSGLAIALLARQQQQRLAILALPPPPPPPPLVLLGRAQQGQGVEEGGVGLHCEGVVVCGGV